jgi:Haem-binding domain
MFKKILLVFIIIILIIQFIHPARNISDNAQPNNVGKAFTIPANVQTILDKACMDCHSNNTRYPWYFKIQPVDWWLTHHVVEGKRGLNFDEYTNRSLRYQFHKMEEIAEQVKEGEMPLKSYTWIHKDAILSAEEKNTLIMWTQEIREEMKAKYPADSLIRRKQ